VEQIEDDTKHCWPQSITQPSHTSNHALDKSCNNKFMGNSLLRYLIQNTFMFFFFFLILVASIPLCYII
jgi:hypothetical protein